MVVLAFVITILDYNFYEIESMKHNYYLKPVPWIDSNIFFYLITVFVLGSIIGWRFIFSIIKQPYSLKQKLADWYIIFLVCVLNHGQPPSRFILFNSILGLFLGRRLIWFMSIPYPKSLLMITVFPAIFPSLIFIIIYGFFGLCIKYPKTFGKFLVNFFENNASIEVISLIDLEKRERFLNKKKLILKKRKASRNSQKKKLNFRSRKYSTTQRVTAGEVGIYELYAGIKARRLPASLVLEQLKLKELGRMLDQTSGISSEDAFNILDRCFEHRELCSSFIMELAKSPDQRNLAINTYSTVKSEFRLEASLSQKKGVGFKADVKFPLESKQKDLQKGMEAVTDAKAQLAETTKMLTDPFSGFFKQGKNAVIKTSVTSNIYLAPFLLIGANLSLAIHSQTYTQSLNTATDDFCRIEELVSFDSNDEYEDYVNWLKMEYYGDDYEYQLTPGSNENRLIKKK